MAKRDTINMGKHYSAIGAFIRPEKHEKKKKRKKKKKKNGRTMALQTKQEWLKANIVIILPNSAK